MATRAKKGVTPFVQWMLICEAVSRDDDGHVSRRSIRAGAHLLLVAQVRRRGFETESFAIGEEQARSLRDPASVEDVRVA